MKKKVMLVFGTRPEAIKMAPLVQELQRRPMTFETLVCLTGQHREMLHSVLEVFDITSDYDLDIMNVNQDITDVTSRVLLGLRDVFAESKPDMVLVHGDTTTAMAATLAAYYAGIPVGHVEAGLRTHNIYSPYPEEGNRAIIGRLASYHFAPTKSTASNLIAEQIPKEHILVTGNTVIDALKWMLDTIERKPALLLELQDDLANAGYDLNRLSEKRRMVLITAHRRENFGTPLLEICTAIKKLSETWPEVDFLYPMHMNPNVREAIHHVWGKNLEEANPNTFFIEPQGYQAFCLLLSRCHIVLTDSGGLQEEAPSLGKPALVMRLDTERPEAVASGGVRLVGTSAERIIAEVSALLYDEEAYQQMSMSGSPYGDGLASQRIADFIEALP